MSSIVIQPIISSLPNSFRATLKIDIDPDAERFLVFDRVTIEIINLGIRPPSGTAYFIVPDKYANTDKLLVGILDDNEAFNAKFIDGVFANLENVQGLDMSQ